MRGLAEKRVRVNPEQQSARLIPIEHVLVNATTIGTAETIFTVRDLTIAQVARLCVANTSASSVDFTLHAVPNAGSAATANTELPAVAIPGNTAVDLTEFIGGLYQSGATLQVFASTTDVLVVHGWVQETF